MILFFVIWVDWPFEAINLAITQSGWTRGLVAQLHCIALDKAALLWCQTGVLSQADILFNSWISWPAQCSSWTWLLQDIGFQDLTLSPGC